MFDILLNHNVAFLGGEAMLGLSLALFGAAWAGSIRERYSIRIPVSRQRD